MKLIDYIQGNRRGKEANQLEREAMNDPFLQDAIDGFDAVAGDHLSAIHDLENQLRQKATKLKQRVNYRLWAVGVAASVILLLGIGSLLRYEMQKPDNTAFRVPKTVVIPPKDTIDSFNPTTESPQKVLAQHVEKQKALETSKIVESKKVVSGNTQSVSVTDSDTLRDIAPVLAQNKAELKSAAEPNNPLILKQESADNALQGRMAGVVVIRGSSSLNQNSVSDNRISTNMQKGKITGKVVDAKGEPVIGATVKIKGKNTGVVTDMSGDFELPATIGKDKLEASYIGYDKKEILANADSNIIRMSESQLALNEVVVVGYGTRKMTSMTGSVSSISTKKTIFGEKEFRKYYDQHRSQNICVDSVANIHASFYIDKSGTPTDLIVQKSTCEVLTKEFTRLLKNSPKWTALNRKVELRMELK